MTGKVFLVGAGPGDPDLLTVKALRLLQSAEVVLHDALVSDDILGLIRPSALVIDVGKRQRMKLLTQSEINSLLVSYARNHATVIRLKGGDPSIFGRAGEEIEEIRNAGIEFEIVPGITSALASAATAGISLTDRRIAASVVFTTAHRGRGDQRRDWDKLVTSGSTLAIYMPGSDYDSLSRDLLDAGLNADTACAVVSHAGRNECSVLWATVHSLENAAPLPAPSLVIVGECARALSQLSPVSNPDNVADGSVVREDLRS